MSAAGLRSVIDGAPSVKAKSAHAKNRSFPVTWMHEATVSMASHTIIKGLVNAGDFVVVYGPSGSGKSFFTEDVVAHVACGIPWRGRRVGRALVVYVASEAGASILCRFVAWRSHKLSASDETPIPLAIMTKGPNLLEEMDVAALLVELRALGEECGLPLGVVVFDTLSRSIPGGDENSAGDMTRVVQAADKIREEFGAATIYVHHSGKDPGKGARGHSALFAAADIVLAVVDRAVTVEKVRDGVAGERFPFSLEVVELGSDPDGDPITTCILGIPDEAGTASMKRRAEPKGKNQKLVLQALREAVSARGERLPGTSAIPAGAIAVSFDVLCQQVVPRFPGAPGFRARGRVSEALVALQAAGLVGVHNERIWLS